MVKEKEFIVPVPLAYSSRNLKTEVSDSEDIFESQTPSPQEEGLISDKSGPEDRFPYDHYTLEDWYQFCMEIIQREEPDARFHKKLSSKKILKNLEDLEVLFLQIARGYCNQYHFEHQWCPTVNYHEKMADYLDLLLEIYVSYLDTEHAITYQWFAHFFDVIVDRDRIVRYFDYTMLDNCELNKKYFHEDENDADVDVLDLLDFCVLED